MVQFRDNMGVALKPLLIARPLNLQELGGKSLAIDAHNTLYQFLSIIRQRDGTPLKDAEGRVTSHLSGLLYRTANLVDAGIKPVYVFDGTPHPLKLQTLERRKALKKEAEQEWRAALAAGDMEEALKKAKRTSRIGGQEVQEAQQLLDALGIPYVGAPGEGEAQAAHMNIKGDVDAVASQDFDALLFGAPVLVRNITVTGKRKLPDKRIWVDIRPEEISLAKMLEEHGIDRENLVDIGILVGTDFNEGIRGIGPKKALQLIKEYGSIEKLVEEGKIAAIPEYEEVRNIFLSPEVTEAYTLTWREADEQRVLELLCDEHQFGRERVLHALEKYKKFAQSFKQRSLFDYP